MQLRFDAKCCLLPRTCRHAAIQSFLRSLQQVFDQDMLGCHADRKQITCRQNDNSLVASLPSEIIAAANFSSNLKFTARPPAPPRSGSVVFGTVTIDAWGSTRPLTAARPVLRGGLLCTPLCWMGFAAISSLTHRTSTPWTVSLIRRRDRHARR